MFAFVSEMQRAAKSVDGIDVQHSFHLLSVREIIFMACQQPNCRQRFSFSIYPVVLSHLSLSSLSISSPKSTIRCCQSERERRLRDERWDLFCICQKTTEDTVDRMIKNGSFLLSKEQVQPTDIPGCLAQTGTLSPFLIAQFVWSQEPNGLDQRGGFVIKAFRARHILTLLCFYSTRHSQTH